MKQKVKSTLTQILKLALAGGLLYYLFHSGRVDLESLKVIASPSVVITGLLTVGLILLFASERWRLLLKQQGLHSSWGKAYRLTLVGTFFNFFVPGGVGGDVMKAVLIAQDHPAQRGQAVLTVLADRILGLFTMVLLALVSFAFEAELLGRDGSFQLIFMGLAVLFVCFILAFWILLSPRAGRLRALIDRWTERIPRLNKLWRFAQTYQLSWQQMLLLGALSLAAQITQILLFMVVASQLTPQLPPVSVFFFAVPVGFMVTAVPIAPAGIGIGQAAFDYLFTKALGTPSNIGVIGVTAFQAFQVVFGIIGALCFVLMRRESNSMSLEKLEETAEKLSEA